MFRFNRTLRRIVDKVHKSIARYNCSNRSQRMYHLTWIRVPLPSPIQVQRTRQVASTLSLVRHRSWAPVASQVCKFQWSTCRWCHKPVTNGSTLEQIATVRPSPNRQYFSSLKVFCRPSKCLSSSQLRKMLTNPSRPDDQTVAICRLLAIHKALKGHPHR